MPSVHRTEKGGQYWQAAFYLPDGRRALRSTGKKNKREAMEVCLKFAEAARLAKEQRLTEYRAREVIADIFHIGNASKLTTMSARAHMEAWLQRKSLELADSSLLEYRKAVDHFLTSLGSKADKPVDAITVADASHFRATMAGQVRGGTVNKLLKILRGSWTLAVKDGLARENIFSRVGLVKSDKTQRRAFTLPELRRILECAGDEWRGIILTALYTGQRLGDVARLTWRNVDLNEREFRLTTVKTGKAMVIPMAVPIFDYLVKIPASDDPAAPVFPQNAATPGESLSNQFVNILANAGLRDAVSHGKSSELKKTRRRKVHDVSFHALRHTATSLLKNAGVSDVVAREIIGHDSESISRAYTHIDQDPLRRAVNMMPDVMNGVPAVDKKIR